MARVNSSLWCYIRRPFRPQAESGTPLPVPVTRGDTRGFGWRARYPLSFRGSLKPQS